MSPVSVVFQGYAPVHALCFLPLYERYCGDPRVEFWFTGGYRRGERPNRTYVDAVRLYTQIGVPADRVLDIETASERRFDVLFSAATHPILPFDRCRTSVQIFHGISMRNRGVRKENLAYDHLWIVGPFMRRLFADLGLLFDGDPRGLSIGFPKTDQLVDGSLDRWSTIDRLGLRGDRPMVLYAPTGAEGNSMERHGLEVASAISGAGSVDLVIKHHDHPRNRGRGPSIEELRSLPGVHVVDDLDVMPLLHASHALITDASSVANEYLLLDRPILFMDVPEVFEVTEQKGAFVDYDSRRTGHVVASPDDVVVALETALAEPDHGSDHRRRRAADLFYNPGLASRVAAEWFEREFLK